VRFQISNN